MFDYILDFIGNFVVDKQHNLVHIAGYFGPELPT